jgi:hypothetical protein
MAVNQQHLKQAWDVSQIDAKEGWNECTRPFSVELMKESCSPSLHGIGRYPPTSGSRIVQCVISFVLDVTL